MKLLRNLSEIFIIYRGNFQHANQVKEKERERDCIVSYANLHSDMSNRT